MSSSPEPQRDVAVSVMPGTEPPALDFGKTAKYARAWGKGPVPQWPVEPTPEAIAATVEAALKPPRETCYVELLHEGAFTKLYVVHLTRAYWGRTEFVMRITLPVCPRLLTESEVAATKWARNKLSRVPRVVTYDSSTNNPLGFEWILMTKMEGEPLSKRWHGLDSASKVDVVTNLAKLFAYSFCRPFKQIGSLREGERANIDHDRGPFSTTTDWLRSRLQVAAAGLERSLGNSATSGDQAAITQRMLDLTKRIEKLMPTFFPPADPHAAAMADDADDGLRTVFCHDSLSMDDILVTDQGLSGILDWKCIPCLPLYAACQFPPFLRMAYDRIEEPDMRRYRVDTNASPHPSYFRDLARYEMTTLRKAYIEAIHQEAPELVAIWRRETSADLRDYQAAVDNCDNEYAIGPVSAWVEAVEAGDASVLSKRLHEQLAE
ncbi:hypothetical protein GGR50DRAFT_706012 [Xylaria sp. CBS 124048]|nr:hypothetical protein GGR50DRAFT_706012 [Xylaria sp. CBS 124048]